VSAPWEKTRYPAAFAGVGFDSVEVVDCDALPPVRTRTDRMVADILEGLRVLNTLHGLAIAEAVLLDRARNITSGILGNYNVTDYPEVPNA
jgi:hypothetical protein